MITLILPVNSPLNERSVKLRLSHMPRVDESVLFMVDGKEIEHFVKHIVHVVENGRVETQVVLKW